MEEWQVGDPTGFGNDAGVPDIPYMGYLHTGDDEDDNDFPPQYIDSDISRARRLAREAFELQNQGRYGEALDLINEALDLDPLGANNWNIKAIILDNWGRNEDALVFYDKSLKIRNDSVVRGNKAQCLYRIAYQRNLHGQNSEKSLEIINEALKLLPDDDGRDDYIRLKGSILESLGRKSHAKKCYFLAAGMTDKIKEIEEQEKIIKNSRFTLINITATKFYKGIGQLKKGKVVDLIKEPENKKDPDAIRVDLNGETVGYVANSSYTLTEGLQSATQIKDKFQDKTRAEVLFLYLDEYVVAQLIWA